MSIDAKILRALRAGNQGVSGAELAVQLGISRAAIWARIEELRTLGYEITASPHRGYCLVNTPETLLADDMLSRLGEEQMIGRDIRVFQETTSTNDVAEKLAQDGVKEGVVVFAETQARGRGRMGRNWHSTAGKGLWFSVLLRPRIVLAAASQLVIAAAVAVARGIARQTGSHPDIKWPNDLSIQGRKVAGILTELNADMDIIKHVVLGIGIDVNHTLQDFPSALREQAISLRMASGSKLNRADLAVAILRELDQVYARVHAGQFGQVAEEWAAHCVTLGRQVVIQMGTRTIRGRAEGLDEDGGLLVRTQHGRLECITSGNVTLEK